MKIMILIIATHKNKNLAIILQIKIMKIANKTIVTKIVMIIMGIFKEKKIVQVTKN